jgi:hypothetical protein
MMAVAGVEIKIMITALHMPVMCVEQTPGAVAFGVGHEKIGGARGAGGR